MQQPQLCCLRPVPGLNNKKITKLLGRFNCSPSKRFPVFPFSLRPSSMGCLEFTPFSVTALLPAGTLLPQRSPAPWQGPQPHSPPAGLGPLSRLRKPG